MPIITVENLSKRYWLGKTNASSLRDALTNLFSKRNLLGDKKEFWALQDINFEVNQGDTFGIIGNNGAGKSTLLKILSRVIKPTTGSATIYGRVGSLLEVGTGFHHELSGRENIFMNGAILGMKQNEIVKKFDEIVAFAEIEQFLDLPVKNYSSGMFMRLAFAIAAHFEPEILIVDEVLAVGDHAFQKKCLEKMKDVSSHGRTILFVSHDISAMTRLCNKAMSLHKGKIVSQGKTQDVVHEYLSSSIKLSASRDFLNDEEPPASDFVKLKTVRIIDENGKTTDSFEITNKVGIEVTYEIIKSGKIIVPIFQIANESRTILFSSHDVSPEWRHREKEIGEYVSTVWIPGNFLVEGSFFINIFLVNCLPYLQFHVSLEEVVCFDITDSMQGETARGDFTGKIRGVVRPLLNWETKHLGK